MEDAESGLKRIDVTKYDPFHRSWSLLLQMDDELFGCHRYCWTYCPYALGSEAKKRDFDFDTYFVPISKTDHHYFLKSEAPRSFVGKSNEKGKKRERDLSSASTEVQVDDKEKEIEEPEAKRAKEDEEGILKTIKTEFPITSEWKEEEEVHPSTQSPLVVPPRPPGLLRSRSDGTFDFPDCSDLDPIPQVEAHSFPEEISIGLLVDLTDDPCSPTGLEEV